MAVVAIAIVTESIWNFVTANSQYYYPLNCASFQPYFDFRVEAIAVVRCGTFACSDQIDVACVERLGFVNIIEIVDANRIIVAQELIVVVKFTLAHVAFASIVINAIELLLDEGTHFVVLVSCSSCFGRGFIVMPDQPTSVSDFDFTRPEILFTLFVFIIEHGVDQINEVLYLNPSSKIHLMHLQL